MRQDEIYAAYRAAVGGDYGRVARLLGEVYAGTLIKKEPRSREESLAGACLLLDMLELYGITPSEVARNECGKPYFTDGALPRFSISHDGGAVLCALSPAGEVGADIMALPCRRSREQLVGITRRWFGEDEIYACETAGEDTEVVFSGIFTRREAYSKYAGGALTGALRRDLPSGIALETFSVPTPGGEGALTVSVCHKPGIRTVLFRG